MIEEPFVFLCMLLISLVMSHFLLGERAGVIQPIAFRLFYVGVIFHELSHYITCLMVGIKPEQIKVKWRNEKFGFRSPHGSVRLSRIPTFLQALVVSIAPLCFSTWLIFGLLYGVVLNSIFDPIIKVIAIFLIVSLFLTAAPSSVDLQMITRSFRENTSHSWYQVLLVSVSTCILWFILIFTHISFLLDVFYYFAIAGIYLFIKFSLIGSRKLIVHASNLNYSKPSKVRMRPFTHKHYKPKKPPKRR